MIFDLTKDIKERLRIKDSKYRKLSILERKIRKWLIEFTVDNSRAFNLDEDSEKAAKDFNLNLDKLKEIIKEMNSKNIFVMDEEGNINFIYPVSAVPTNHRVTLKDGRSFYSMCAIDSIGTTFTFNQDVHIESVCSQCEEKIIVDIVDKKILKAHPETVHVLHVDLNKTENWAGSC